MEWSPIETFATMMINNLSKTANAMNSVEPPADTKTGLLNSTIASTAHLDKSSLLFIRLEKDLVERSTLKLGIVKVKVTISKLLLWLLLLMMKITISRKAHNLRVIFFFSKRLKNL